MLIGACTQVPEGDESLATRAQMRASIDVNLGGRVAEELVFGSDQVCCAMLHCIALLDCTAVTYYDVLWATMAHQSNALTGAIAAVVYAAAAAAAGFLAAPQLWCSNSCFCLMQP